VKLTVSVLLPLENAKPEIWGFRSTPPGPMKLATSAAIEKAGGVHGLIELETSSSSSG
jgi:hypothetical protein